MVFGYYHVSIREIDASKVPELGLEKGTKITQKVKLAHILWIPIFPMKKIWTVDQYGQMYAVNDKAVKLIENKYGPKSYPWYSFLGLILIFVGPSLFSGIRSMKGKANKARYESNFKKDLDEKNEYILAPTDKDLYHFKGDDYKSIVFNVNHSTADSIYFDVPREKGNIRWKDKKYATSFFIGDNPTMILAFSKEDLNSSYRKLSSDRKKNIGIISKDIDYIRSPLYLENVYKIEQDDKLPIISATLNKEITSSFNFYLSHSANIDSMLMLLDSASINYLEKVFLESQKSDKEVVSFYKNYQKVLSKKESSSYKRAVISRYENHCLYEQLLYTRYVFHGLNDGITLVDHNDTQVKELTQESFKSFVFFLRLLEKGFLSMEGEYIRATKIKSISTPSKDKAVLHVYTSSNLLITPRDISFNVTMVKEDNQWKLNLPSSMSYTYNQIISNGSNDYLHRQWREKIREEVSKLTKGNNINQEWIF